MKNIAIIGLSTIIIALTIRTNSYLADRFIAPFDYAPIQSYADSYDRLNKKSRRPQYDPVVVCVLDGALRQYLYDDTTAASLTAAWKDQGLRFTDVSCMLPSVSAPNYYSILTGAPVYMHGIINNQRRLVEHQRMHHFIAHLARFGLNSLVIGFSWYKEMLGKTVPHVPVECDYRHDSPEVAGELIKRINARSLPSFTLVHFTAPDSVAHTVSSTTDPAYIGSIKTIDRLIGQAWEGLRKQYASPLLLVLSDHGMNIDGKHGGTDAASVSIPLYALAKNLKSRSIDRPLYNIAIVPTLAALYGIPIPALCAGPLIDELIAPDRVSDYQFESINKKERILGMIRGSDIVSITVDADLRQSLRKRDSELTEMIIEHPRTHREQAVRRQWIPAGICGALFILWMIYSAPRGMPIILIINTACGLAFGLCMPIIHSNYRLDNAIAVYAILSIMILALYRYLFFDSSMPGSRFGLSGQLQLLAALLVNTIIISGFFVPFYTFIADQHIFEFRFFSLYFLNPFILTASLRLMEALKMNR